MRIFLALLLVFTLAGCSGFWGGGSAQNRFKLPEGDRYIVLQHKPSGERVAVTYFSNNRYDSSALRKLNHLMRDRKTGQVATIDPVLFDFMVAVRNRLILPQTQTIEITSGYRSQSTNNALREQGIQAARGSLHLEGRAADLRFTGISNKAVAEVAKTIYAGGVAWYASSNHVHLDTGPARSWQAR